MRNLSGQWKIRVGCSTERLRVGCVTCWLSNERVLTVRGGGRGSLNPNGRWRRSDQHGGAYRRGQPQHSPELCQQLSSFYTFMYTRLMAAIGERSPAIVEEVLGLLRYERETWSMLLEQLAEENAAARGLTETPQAQPPQPAHASGSSLIGGSVSVKG